MIYFLNEKSFTELNFRQTFNRIVTDSVYYYIYQNKNATYERFYNYTYDTIVKFLQYWKKNERFIVNNLEFINYWNKFCIKTYGSNVHNEVINLAKTRRRTL